MAISTIFGLFVEFSFETMSDKSQSEKFKKALSTLNDNQLLVLKSSIVNKCEEIAEGGNIYGIKYCKT